MGQIEDVRKLVDELVGRVEKIEDVLAGRKAASELAGTSDEFEKIEDQPKDPSPIHEAVAEFVEAVNEWRQHINERLGQIERKLASPNLVEAAPPDEVEQQKLDPIAVSGGLTSPPAETDLASGDAGSDPSAETPSSEQPSSTDASNG